MPRSSFLGVPRPADRLYHCRDTVGKGYPAKGVRLGWLDTLEVLPREYRGPLRGERTREGADSQSGLGTRGYPPQEGALLPMVGDHRIKRGPLRA